VYREGHVGALHGGAAERVFYEQTPLCQSQWGEHVTGQLNTAVLAAACLLVRDAQASCFAEQQSAGMAISRDSNWFEQGKHATRVELQPAASPFSGCSCPERAQTEQQN
jgi:hypothetical protein